MARIFCIQHSTAARFGMTLACLLLTLGNLPAPAQTGSSKQPPTQESLTRNSQVTPPAVVASADVTGAVAADGDGPSSATTFLHEVVIRTDATAVTRRGRVLVAAQDGGLLFEDRSGRILTLTPDRLVTHRQLPEPFSPLSAPEQQQYLQQLTNDDFQILMTDHYILCSGASAAYNEFCGQLLELVYAEFFRFFAETKAIPLRVPGTRLPVIILPTQTEFEAFASVQHPETSFEGVPGYYSVRENLVLLVDLTSDPNVNSSSAIRRKLASMPRQAATVVHEAVHQLAFNTGVQVRMADNPVWLSEGLAVWFEPISARSPFLWSRPGLVNPVHHPAISRMAATSGLPIALRDLLRSDQPFLDPTRSTQAYAECWGLTTYLIRNEREGFDRLLQSVSQRKPLVPLSPEEREQEFAATIGRSSDEIERVMVPYIARLRAPREGPAR